VRQPVIGLLAFAGAMGPSLAGQRATTPPWTIAVFGGATSDRTLWALQNVVGAGTFNPCMGGITPPNPNSTFTVAGFLTPRLPFAASLRPYVLAGGGVLWHRNSTVTTEGGFGGTFVTDTAVSKVSPELVFGVGASAPLGAARRLRIEARDLAVAFDYVSGKPDVAEHAPVRRKFFHSLVVSVGLEIALNGASGLKP
jgi:hypothetical protein